MKFNSISLLTSLLCLPLLSSALPQAGIPITQDVTAEELAELRAQEPLFDLDDPKYATELTNLMAAFNAGTVISPEASKISKRYEWYNDPARAQCETSGASPYADNVQNCINYLIGRGTERCQQKNKFGSKCTTLTRYGNGAIGVCGSSAPEAWNNCNRFGWAAQTVLNKCTSGGKVGGQYPFPSALRMIVFTKNK
ncbi:hypothetical protein BJ508DRAFT_416887 [Ascobolus immersus RN42]|uniref:Secreted protein n=1 Tax=Ascobolus immersus RN42 TaxID=1160509 RepID=A0A3N4HX09_ASCIM|nr:hypothetical protein BJ508DRAFT_416887 [Ascobolus immersus RN42]